MTRVERVLMEEMWLEVAAAAIRHRHPQVRWIAEHSYGLPIPLSDAALQAAVERIGQDRPGVGEGRPARPGKTADPASKPAIGAAQGSRDRRQG